MNLSLYPEIKPFEQDFLKVSDLHSLYYEECGNPKGQAIVFLHGGPGGGIDHYHRQLFDPKHYRIILFDQRGCGHSTPFAELDENTIWDLVEDLEKLRKHLKVDKWLVCGGSWGATLALTYAIQYPENIKAMILRAVFLCRKSELLWFYQEGASWIFPDEWEKFNNFIPEDERADLIGAYYKRLISKDRDLRLQASLVWSHLEAATVKLIPDAKLISKYEAPEKALPFARIECHYFYHGAFFKTPNYILENVEKIRKIPCRIIHGRYDVVTPVKNAWDLHRIWPESELLILPNTGHSATEIEIKSELIRASNDFRKY